MDGARKAEKKADSELSQMIDRDIYCSNVHVNIREGFVNIS